MEFWIVTTHREITVTAWSESQDPLIPQKPAPQRFLPPGIIGFAGTLLLHGLALQSVLLGSRAHNVRPPEIQEPGSTLNKPAGKPADALVFIDVPKTGKATDEIHDALASVRAAIKDSPIPVTHPDPSPPRDIEALALGEDNDSQSSIDSGDGAEKVRLFGIYTGQIQARVERVWQRPRTPVQEGSDPAKAAVSAEYFQCQVQIVQDAGGNVKEILLPNCNGSVAWQRSLVMAIQQASPLPAPPSPKVFSHAIALDFVGYAYRTGSPEEEYEIAPLKVVQALSTLPASRPTQLISDSSSSTPAPLLQ
jgi:TonB C terminal